MRVRQSRCVLYLFQVKGLEDLFGVKHYCHLERKIGYRVKYWNSSLGEFYSMKEKNRECTLLEIILIKTKIWSTSHNLLIIRTIENVAKLSFIINYYYCILKVILNIYIYKYNFWKVVSEN